MNDTKDMEPAEAAREIGKSNALDAWDQRHTYDSDEAARISYLQNTIDTAREHGPDVRRHSAAAVYSFCETWRGLLVQAAVDAMSPHKVRVTLHASNGTGAYGTGATFEKAHMVAWKHWRDSHEYKGPHSADVDGADRPGLERIAVVAPPVSAVVALHDQQTIEPADLRGHFDDLQAHLDDLRAYFMGGITNGSGHGARHQALCLMRGIADIDQTLAAYLLKKATQ